MSTGAIEAFHAWFSAHRETLSIAGLAVEFVMGASEDARSAWVDLESEAKIGRATIWDSGLCDLEVLSVESGEQMLYLHHEQLDSQQMMTLLDEFAERFSRPA